MSTPYWPRPLEQYPGVLPARTDVLVIGGGITGVSLLHHLTRRGVDAVLVERLHLASGASGRNAGFLLAGVADSYAEAVRLYGRTRARDIWALTNENHDSMVESIGAQPVGHHRRGTVILASSPEEALQLDESAQLLAEDGFASRWDGRCLVNPRDGEVNPSALVGALARLVPSGAIREGVDVTAIEAAAGEVTVRAGTATSVAGAVILATNAYTPLLLPQVPIKPIRAQMLATDPITDRVCDLPTYSHFGYRYWRQLDGGEVLVGGWRDTTPETEVGYDDRPTAAIQDQLDGQLEHMGVKARVANRWAGTMGFTESGLPFVGPVEGLPNVYVCAGYNGHGMGFAFVSARMLVARL